MVIHELVQRNQHAAEGTAASAAVAARAATAARASQAARASSAAKAARGGAAAKAGRGGAASKATRGASAGKVRSTKTSSGDAKGKASGKPRTRKVELRTAALSAERSHFGDHSFTYKAPGLHLSDSFSMTAPVVLAKYSPIASAVVLDGTYLRAIFGSLAAILPIVGLIVGLAAGISSHGLTTPLSLEIFTGLLVAGLFDAATGVFGSLGVLVTTIAYGSIFSLTGFTTVVVVASLWSGLGVMVGKVRLFVKDTPEHIAAWYERLGDIIIGSLLISYLALKFIGLLSGANDSLAVVHDAAEPLAIWLLIATAIKYLVTTAVSHYYPQRLMAVYPTIQIKRVRRITLTSLFARAIASLLVFSAFLGFNWLVVILLALYLIDVTLPDAVTPSDKPTWLGLVVPSNLGKILFLSMASAVAFLALQDVFTSGQQLVTVSLIVVMIVAIINNVAAARWPSAREVPHVVLYTGGIIIAILTLLQLTDHLIKT
jgi:hypothetical protein